MIKQQNNKITTCVITHIIKYYHPTLQPDSKILERKQIHFFIIIIIKIVFIYKLKF